MTGVLRFSVDGHPAPQGSKTGLGRGRMREANPRTKGWRETVAWQVRAQLPAGHTPIQGPVFWACLFAMPKHGSVPKRRRTWPVTRFPGSGDEDKLLRACADALTAAGVWGDDSQIVRTLAGTDWEGAPGFRSTPGVSILVAPIGSDHLADLPIAWLTDIGGDHGSSDMG